MTVDQRNQSPYGWWIASYIGRQVWDDNPDPGPRSRCTAWENTVILQAPDRDAAYEKACQLGQTDFDDTFSTLDESLDGHWVFEGVTTLMPIYDELGDGAEVLWTVHENRAVSTIRSMVRSKADLPVFHDDDGPS